MIAPALSTTSTLLTDEDNPLIDRKYPNDTAQDDIALPQIYRFEFSQIPDFSQTTMQIEAVATQAVADDAVLNEDNLRSLVNHTNNHLNKPLSTRQVLAKAKAKAKEREYQQQIEEEKQHAEAVARYKAEVEAALLNPKIHDGLLNQRKSIAESQAVVKKHAIFGELAQDLQTIDLPDTTVNEPAKQIYEKAIAMLNSAESGNVDNVDNAANLQKAIQVVEKFADHGIADALLRKALWLFEGNTALDISQNTDAALKILQSVATQNDNRAQKLLSRLYYAGHLVEQDSEMGEYWLELAAAHGHPEAIRISQGIATMAMLKQTQREENNDIKKMGIGLAILILLMLLIFVVVKI